MTPEEEAPMPQMTLADADLYEFSDPSKPENGSGHADFCEKCGATTEVLMRRTNVLKRVDRFLAATPAPAAGPQEGEPSTEAGRELVGRMTVLFRAQRESVEHFIADIRAIETEARASAPAAEPQPDPEASDAPCGCGAIGVAAHTNAEHFPAAEPQEGEPRMIDSEGDWLIRHLRCEWGIRTPQECNEINDPCVPCALRLWLDGIPALDEDARKAIAASKIRAEAEARASAPAAEPAVTEALRRLVAFCESRGAVRVGLGRESRAEFDGLLLAARKVLNDAD